MVNRWVNESFQYSEPSEDFYEKELEKIHNLLADFCAVLKIEKESVSVNIKALRQIIRRVDMRWLYFKIYHNDMEINEYKINAGLTVFWILKLHPFWLNIDPETQDDEVLELAEQFNEKFAVHIVLDLLHEYNPNFIDKGEDLLKAYCDELVYSFRYRDLSKESLFLMFDPFYYLYFFNSSVNDEGELKL